MKCHHLPFLLICLLLFMSCGNKGSLLYVDDVPEPQFSEGDNPCVNFDKSTNTFHSLLQAAETHSRATKFVELLKKLEQEDPHFFADVKGKAKYTLLLPTNAAMNAFLEEYAQVDLSGVNLTTLVKHHFLIDPVEFRTFRSTYYVAMNREILPATRDLNNCVSFGNGGRIVLADDFCSNGIIHLIDKVLIPTRNFN